MLFIKLKYKISPLVYTPGELAYFALVGVQSQYVVNFNEVLKVVFSLSPNVPKFHQNVFKKVSFSC